MFTTDKISKIHSTHEKTSGTFIHTTQGGWIIKMERFCYSQQILEANSICFCLKKQPEIFVYVLSQKRFK